MLHFVNTLYNFTSYYTLYYKNGFIGSILVLMLLTAYFFSIPCVFYWCLVFYIFSLLNLFYGMLSYVCKFFCYYLSATTFASPPTDPCVPSPCGPYSQCRVINNTPACSCLASYIGQPPNCRPECVIHADCPSNLACTNERCTDPCPGSCGLQANCYVINHNPVCTCSPGYTGNALVACQLEPSKILILLYLGQEKSVIDTKCI